MTALLWILAVLLGLLLLMLAVCLLLLCVRTGIGAGAYPSLAAAEARGSAAADCRGAGKTQKKAEKIQIPVFFSA